MQEFIAYSNLIIGSILIIGALMVQTRNWQSSFLFKVVPMFSGLIILFNALTMLEWFKN